MENSTFIRTWVPPMIVMIVYLKKISKTIYYPTRANKFAQIGEYFQQLRRKRRRTQGIQINIDNKRSTVCL